MPRISVSRIVVAVSILLLLLIAGSYCYFELKRISGFKQAVKDQERVLAEKQKSVSEYREQVSFYKTKEGMEHLAREQYNLVKPGERVIILKNDISATPLDTTEK